MLLVRCLPSHSTIYQPTPLPPLSPRWVDPSCPPGILITILPYWPWTSSPIPYPEYHFTIHNTYFTPVPLMFCLPIDPLTTSCHTIRSSTNWLVIPLIISLTVTPFNHFTQGTQQEARYTVWPFAIRDAVLLYYYDDIKTFWLQHILVNYLYNSTKPGGTQYT